jgi:hypothetical protein
VANKLKKTLRKIISPSIIALLHKIQYLPQIIGYKSIYLNKKYTKQGYNQISNVTQEDRYPEIFNYMTTLLTHDNPKILSFGCSYGLECFSLRKYFHSATIIGYDINKNNICKAKKNNVDPKIFFCSKLEKVPQAESYDAVFAMSVLCRWWTGINKGDLKDCSKVYSFTQFSEQVEMLDGLIKDGGYLIIYSANFRFTDTAVSKKYEPIQIPGYIESGTVAKFSINNQYLEDQNYEYSIFKKIPTQDFFKSNN